jgi:hypothetical protein
MQGLLTLSRTYVTDTRTISEAAVAQIKREVSITRERNVAFCLPQIHATLYAMTKGRFHKTEMDARG